MALAVAFVEPGAAPCGRPLRDGRGGGALLRERGVSLHGSGCVRRIVLAPGETVFRVMTLADDLPHAFACWRGGDCVEAERLCRALLADNPGHPGVLSVLVLALHGQHNHTAALEAARQAIARAPLAGHLHHNAGVCLTALGRSREAAAFFQQAVALLPALAPSAPRPYWRACGAGMVELDLGFVADDDHARAARLVHPPLTPPRR